MRQLLRSASIIVVLAVGLRAETIVEETYQLAAGWNLIQVAFEAANAVAALESVDWDSVWAFVPGAGPQRKGRWAVAYRAGPAFLNTMTGMPSPGSYAILMKSAGVLNLKGPWRPDRPSLRGGEFQLFGPRVPEVAPTLADYLSRSGVKERVGPVFELVQGAFRRVGDGDALRPGAAYWVFPAQDVPAPEPLRIDAGFGGLRFDSQTTVQEIELDVASAPEMQTLNVRATASADGSGIPSWLEYQKPDASFAAVNPGAALEVPPGSSTLRVVFRARRQGAAVGAATQAALIEISGPRGGTAVGAELTSPTLQGIWTGEAVLSEVERMSLYGAGYGPSPKFSLALIVEIPATGRPRLLPCLQIEANVAGRGLRYRMVAALFPDAVELTGAVVASGSSGLLSGTVTMPPEHPLNPYRHRYHPEHGVGYDVSRSINLRFGAQGPASVENPFATVGVLTGVYEEEIGGLAQEPIHVRGTFQLRRFAAGTATPCATAAR